MKQTIILMIATSATLFSSQVSENLRSIDTLSIDSKPIQEQVASSSRESVGHFNFKIGPAAYTKKIAKPIPIFLIGYQSPISNDSVFQSSYVDFGGGYIGNNLEIWYHPKIGGISYINPKGKNRLYTTMGGHLATSYLRDDHKYHADTYIGSSLGFGVELGESDQAINKIEISHDIPLISLDDNRVDMINNGVTMITYSVGF